MTGIATNCVYDARILLALSLGAHALALQGLNGTNQSFHPFIHLQLDRKNFYLSDAIALTTADKMPTMHNFYD